jgi:hypothetical protein
MLRELFCGYGGQQRGRNDDGIASLERADETGTGKMHLEAITIIEGNPRING